MAKNVKVAPNQYMTKKQKTLYEDMGMAILKYCKTKFGYDFGEKGQSVYFDDVKMFNSSKGNGWFKMEFYFKVVE